MPAVANTKAQNNHFGGCTDCKGDILIGEDIRAVTMHFPQTGGRVVILRKCKTCMKKPEFKVRWK